MSKTKVLTGKERKAQILEAGAKLAAKLGTVNVTRRDVAKACSCAEALVSRYMGDTATAQKAYARKAKAMGLALPSKAEADAIGVKMRAHGPRDKRDTRKRSAKEVEAIKRKTTTRTTAVVNGVKVTSTRTTRETKPVRPPRRPTPVPQEAPLPVPGNPPLPGPSEHKSAARAPKAPPSLPSS